MHTIWPTDPAIGVYIRTYVLYVQYYLYSATYTVLYITVQSVDVHIVHIILCIISGCVS